MLRLILSLTALIASTCGKEEVKLPRAQLDEDFRLSGDLEPLHYLLRIWFDPEESGHPGFVEVTLRVVRPTSRIVIHSFQLDLKEATYECNGSVKKSLPPPILNVFQQTATFQLGEELPFNATCGLGISYQWRLSPNLLGAFEDTEQVFLVMTKFETIMARKFFPCFDEPRYKASYVINAATPSRLSTLLDVKSNSKLDYFVPGNKWPNKVQYSPVVNESGVALQCFGVADPKTLLSLVDAMAYGLRYMDKELGEEFHMLHEMAHNWFGNLVTCEDWNDIWLQEGFATFYTLRMEGGNPYARGAIVIRLLEASLGRDLYLRSIRLFIHRFANKCATSKDFIDTVLSAAEPGEIGLSYEQLRAFLVNEAHVVLDSAKPWIMPIFYTLNGKKKRAWMMHRKVSIPIPNNVIFKFDPQHILLCKYDK